MFQAGGAHTSGQAVSGVVGLCQRSDGIANADDGGDRAEDLLAVDAHRVDGVDKQCRLKVVAWLPIDLGHGFTTVCDPRALVPAGRDVRTDLLEL